MAKTYFVTSESVTEGHPDKICDQVSDAIVDNLFAQDPMSRVAVETMTTTGLVICAGEVTTRGYADVQKIVRATLKDIGYTDPQFGIDCEDAGVLVSIHGQSANISQGVTEGADHEQGAGDQGMMYGFACNETPELMPLPIILAHKLTRRMAEVRKNGEIKHIGPDGKSQVSVEYEDGKPKRIDAVVIAQQHKKDISEDELKKEILEKVVKPVCGYMMDAKTKVHINATGVFVIGGPEGDTGVTGRKIIVDSYGGVGRHGGGAFSGKDPTKVDRSGAYVCRYVAKNIVAAGLADKCEVALSYAIGVAEPTSINVDCFGTNKIPEDKINELVRKHFNLKPRGIIESLKLRNPIYRETANYGHFGREPVVKDVKIDINGRTTVFENIEFFTWEKTDKAEILKKEAGL
ncbi:MAG: methionine adenosyltransferase [Candidatus Woesearchaeota archaeon]|nr:methionine adenosyltransferase [Candidatus Woesearchaeota archaeon]